MSSADRQRLRALVPPLAVATLGAGVTGCVSTQQKAGWAHIEAARTIVSQGSTLVRRPGDQLRVTRVTLLRDGRRLAVAVGLRNATGHALNDLPISVGLRGRRGALVYFNRAAGLDYFRTHVAEVPAGGSLTWVFTGRRPRGSLRRGGRPFAVVGDETAAPTTVGRALPRIRAVLTTRSPAIGDGELRVTVTNLSAVPQPELQVYAIAAGGRGYTAAGSATVAELGTGSSTTTNIGLIGRPSNARIRLEALPTLFQ